MLRVPHYVFYDINQPLSNTIFNGSFISLWGDASPTRVFVKLKNVSATTTITLQQALAQGVVRELSTGMDFGWKFNYKENTDPTISVEGAQVGDIWLNNKTGKIFVCTDATIGANKWVCDGKEVNFSNTDAIVYGDTTLYMNSLAKTLDASNAFGFGIALAPPDVAKHFDMRGKPNFSNISSADYGQYVHFNHLGKEIGEFVFIPTIYVSIDDYERNKGFKKEYASVTVTCDPNCDKTKFIAMDAFVHKGKTAKGFFISKYIASLDEDGYFVSRSYKEPCFVGEYFLEFQQGIHRAVGYANDEYKTAIKSIIKPLENQKFTIPHIQQYEVLNFLTFLATSSNNAVVVPTNKIEDIQTEDDSKVIQNKSGVIGIHPTHVINGVGYSVYHKDATWGMVKVSKDKQDTNLGQKMRKIPLTGGLTASLVQFSAHNRRITGVFDISGGIPEISWGMNNNESNPAANTKLFSSVWKKADVTNFDYYDLAGGNYATCDSPIKTQTKANISSTFEAYDSKTRGTASSNSIREIENNGVKPNPTDIINGIRRTPILNLEDAVAKEDMNSRVGANPFFDCNAVTRVSEVLGATPIMHLGINTEEVRSVKFKFSNGEQGFKLAPGVSEASVAFMSCATVPNSIENNFLKQATETFAFRLMHIMS